MQKLSIIFFSVTLVLFYSCTSEETGESSITDEPVVVDSDSSESIQKTEEEIIAIALWNTTLREAPVLEKVAWVKNGAFVYGDRLFLTGDTAMVGNTAFSRAKLLTGETGWVKDYLIAKDAKVSVVIEPTSIFDNPSIMALDRENRLETGQIVVVINDKDGIGFSKFYGKEKKIHGWIKTDSNVSSEDVDIEVALLRKAALEEEDPALQVIKIQEILENPDYMSSKLYAQLAAKVQNEVDEEEVMGEMDEEMIPIYEEEGL